MPEHFNDLYRDFLKDAVLEKARADIEQGEDALARADTYAERGKPDFVLAYLSLIDASDEVKRNLYAHAYERRARLSEEKAEALDREFHRPFPLIKVGAQKDRLTAQLVRQGQHILGSSKSLKMN